MAFKENTQKRKISHECIWTIIGVFIFSCCYAMWFFFSIRGENLKTSLEPNMTIASINFTMLKTSETCFSVKWDLTIRVPGSLPGSYICLHGDYQASLLYKDTTNTTPIKSYKHLQHGWPNLHKISGVVSEEDISSAIRKSIMDDIKKRSEVRYTWRYLPIKQERAVDIVFIKTNENDKYFPLNNYKHLQHGWPHLVNMSGVVSEKDIGGATGKIIMDNIEKSGLVEFELQLLQEKIHKGVVNIFL